jgi:hypothetical protein
MRLMRLKRPSLANKTDEANGGGPIRPTRLKRPSTANEANEADEDIEADVARPMRLMRLKRLSPADKADKANGAKPMGLMRAMVDSIFVGIIGAGGWMNNVDSPVHERRLGRQR